MNKKHLGFTLIEILIALTIFAILASITSSILYYAFNTRTRVNAHAERLNNLQLALSLMQQDIPQITQRAIRGGDMRLIPSFIGMIHYLEFTRDGNQNPQSIEKRSTLKRIALVCDSGKLIRRTWLSLDPINRNQYQDKILLRDLNDCYFNYLNQNSQLLAEWRAQPATEPNQRKESLPKAVQVNVQLKNWGDMNLLFIIPGALYVPH